MSPPERLLRAVDGFQQRHRPLAFSFAVVKKFGDDRGGSLAALLAYHAFLAVFPLLLLLTTALGYLIDKNSSISRAILDSALRDFPIVGPQLTRSVHPLEGGAIAVIIGGVGLLWGSLGFSQAGQFAMAEAWNVPNVQRPGFFPRLVRSLGLVATLGAGIALTTVVAAAATVAPWAVAGRGFLLVGSVAVNVGLFLVMFRVLTPHIGSRSLVPGAIVGGIGWSVLQAVGALLVAHQLRNASQLYGYFGSVLGLIAWLYIAAQLLVYAAEVNVVRDRRLWPRSIVQPPLTEADKETLDLIAEQGERRPEQSVRSHWRKSA
ncbi:MAG: hypothetical protein QOI61_953 [Actinomycetota bacterium]